MSTTPTLAQLVDESVSAVGVLAHIAQGKVSVKDHAGRTLCAFDEGPATEAPALSHSYRIEAEPVGTVEVQAERAEDAIELVKELFNSVYRRKLVAEIYQETLSDSYEELLAKNQRLERLTESLEQDVAQRTQELDKAHAHLARESKVAAIARLAAGLAHELNTPLACVRCNLSTLHDYRSPEDETEFTEIVTESVDMIDKVASIVSDLLGLAHSQEIGLSLIDLREELERLIRCLQVPSGVDIETCFSETPSIEVDGKRFSVALLHILENACDAVGAKGSVRISTEEVGGAVVLCVDDDGPGMAPEVLEHAFDPFFTTKEVGSGVGLGLTVSRDVVRAHGGALELDSAPGRGTRVRMLIPVVREGMEA